MTNKCIFLNNIYYFYYTNTKTSVFRSVHIIIKFGDILIQTTHRKMFE